MTENFCKHLIERQNLDLSCMQFDSVAFFQALTRYSRDIYHAKRIDDFHFTRKVLTKKEYSCSEFCTNTCYPMLKVIAKTNGTGVETTDPVSSKKLALLFH
jgi:hypothetical protein